MSLSLCPSQRTSSSSLSPQAVCFVDLLTLASDRRLQITQEAPYDEIRVGRGPAFELRTEDLPGVAQTIDEEGE